jgi:deazaflavin-dependent oxidoreductase (nitroreductase family)
MPSDLQLKAMNAIHRGILALSFGKLGWDAAGMPALELTTVGRKSGEKRSVMLTSPLQLGDTIVVVASRGGDPTHPAWFLNLRDNPDVEVAYKGGKRKPMKARVATAEERAELWPKVTSAYKGYAGYQEKTTREIPLVLLDPVG